MLLDLPNDALRSVALHLEAPEVLNLLSTHTEFQTSLGNSATFWQELTHRDFDVVAAGNNSKKCPKAARTEYLTNAYTNHLPAAQWHPIRRNPHTTVSAREGHLACTLPAPDGGQRVVITGGYSDDDAVHVMTVPSCKTTNSSWSWSRLMPAGNCRSNFAYGASLTPLDENIIEEDGTHVARAIRFGGFQAGGYSHEVNQVWLLTVRTEQSGNTTVSWELVPTTNPPTSRAYHTATLVAGRYLVILGGMMWRESILGEAILDTQTWTWMTDPISTFGDDQPSGRHGHSVIFDNRRNRLVLFGGGSGTDLLRSGRDNSEVWELKMNQDWETKLTLPWTWSKLHKDTCDGQSDSDNDDEEASTSEGGDQAGGSDSPPLSPAEALCIGRCHHGLKVTPNTAVLLFGSGRPSTNGMVGYNLAKDCFVRPNISGPLPTPRFSGVAVYLEQEGYILTQGGYSSQQSDCIDDLAILDLAPSMKREFTVLPVDMARRPHREITNADAENGRMNRYGGNMYQQHQFLTQMLALTRGGLVSAEELQEMLASRGIVSNNGVVVLGGDDSDDYDDDDEDYVEE